MLELAWKGLSGSQPWHLYTVEDMQLSKMLVSRVTRVSASKLCVTPNGISSFR